MDEKTMTPISRMADLLAEMAERAVEAERQRDAAKEDSNQWYRHYLSKEEQLKATEELLAAQIKVNEELRGRIAEYIENMEKGAQENERINQSGAGDPQPHA